uniref:alpha/beta hydrolase fold domain-containing protein n=1 Tax=uncultured Sphingomonas sp. TaxID=158754 RepID=UPI0025F2F80D|nr:alpha/beta hydrolase fold domain-containing protein [uncultured Sphingomonas sp.]
MQGEVEQAVDDLEPGVRQFQSQVAADYQRLSTPGIPDIRERRRVAELVRRPWASGGPEMADSRDLRVGDRQVPVRVHRPTGDPGLPALIYVHGGGWMLFSLDTHDRLMREYAARAGVNVVGVDYSLAPEARFPHPVLEAIDVVRWVRSEASPDLLSPASLAIGGDSAGANLAVAANLSLRDGSEAVLDAMLLNYGAFDLERRPSHALYGGPAYTLTPSEMDEFWAEYVPPAERRNPLARPLLADLGGLPPAFLCIAECDILADENREMARRLGDAGVPTTVAAYSGATHSFLEAVSVSPLAERAIGDAASWLAKVLRR